MLGAVTGVTVTVVGDAAAEVGGRLGEAARPAQPRRRRRRRRQRLRRGRVRGSGPDGCSAFFNFLFFLGGSAPLFCFLPETFSSPPHPTPPHPTTPHPTACAVFLRHVADTGPVDTLPVWAPPRRPSTTHVSHDGAAALSSAALGMPPPPPRRQPSTCAGLFSAAFWLALLWRQDVTADAVGAATASVVYV